MAEVLVVEDNPGDVYLTLEALRHMRAEHRVHVVEDGEQAIHYLRGEGPFAHAALPDLVLLDLNLPRKDGNEVLKAIRAQPSTEGVAVVVLSSSDRDVDIHAAYGLRANCFLTKPTEAHAFIEAVRAASEFWLGSVTAAHLDGAGRAHVHATIADTLGSEK